MTICFFAEHLEKARQILRITHGETRSLYSNTLKGLLEELHMHEQVQDDPSYQMNSPISQSKKIKHDRNDSAYNQQHPPRRINGEMQGEQG